MSRLFFARENPNASPRETVRGRRRCDIVNKVLKGSWEECLWMKAHPEDKEWAKSAETECCKVKWGIPDDVDACDPTAKNTDHISRLSCALLAASHFKAMEDGAVPFDAIVKQIESERQPVGVRIQWDGGESGHFVAITGFDPEHKTLTIADPLGYASKDDPGTWATLKYDETKATQVYKTAVGGQGTRSSTYFTSGQHKPVSP